MASIIPRCEARNAYKQRFWAVFSAKGEYFFQIINIYFADIFGSVGLCHIIRHIVFALVWIVSKAVRVGSVNAVLIVDRLFPHIVKFQNRENALELIVDKLGFKIIENRCFRRYSVCLNRLFVIENIRFNQNDFRFLGFVCLFSNWYETDGDWNPTAAILAV